MLGMSRRGKIREGEKHMPDSVKFFAGDCLEPESFKDKLTDVDAVIHCVGGLFPMQKYPRSYEALNRDSCINMAK